jgi:hypothetical protein
VGNSFSASFLVNNTQLENLVTRTYKIITSGVANPSTTDVVFDISSDFATGSDINPMVSVIGGGENSQAKTDFIVKLKSISDKSITATVIRNVGTSYQTATVYLTVYGYSMH